MYIDTLKVHLINILVLANGLTSSYAFSITSPLLSKHLTNFVHNSRSNNVSTTTATFLSTTVDDEEGKFTATATATTTTNTYVTNSDDNDTLEGPMKLESKLKFIGPYPCLPLHFPNLATASQREREVSGISLDFVLDTGANTNTINAQVASELLLETAGSALPGYNSVGYMDGGVTYELGDSCLDDEILPVFTSSAFDAETEGKAEGESDFVQGRELFVTNLTASALPMASPAAAGLFGVGFLNCFPGGVKFNWGKDNDDKSVVFYGDKNKLEDEVAGMRRVPIKIIKDILLPTVVLKLNGVEIQALLDTGSPVTVVNSVAAELAGLNVIQIQNGNNYKSEKEGRKKKGAFGFVNPLKKLGEDFKNANALSQAVSRGDVLVLAGNAGQVVQLLKTKNAPTASLQGEEEDINFPDSNIYVGDLPGLGALGGLNGASSPPVAVLGMDLLTQMPSLLYRMDELFI